MNSDGAASDFIAIQHKVVVLATDLGKEMKKHLSKAGTELHLMPTSTDTTKMLWMKTWHYNTAFLVEPFTDT